MKKLFFLGACLLTLSLAAPSVHAAPPDVVVVRVQETSNKVMLVIARNGRPEELIEFDNGFNEKHLKNVSTRYQQVIQQLYQDGYTLQSTFAIGAGIQITLVFVKGA